MINNRYLKTFFVNYSLLFLLLLFINPAYSEETVTTNDPNTTETSPVFSEVRPDTDIKCDITFNQSFPDIQWWETYKDPILSKYIAKALSNNNDLKIAAYRIEEARAQARELLGYELPVISLQPGYSRQQNSKTLLTPLISQWEGLGPKIFSPGSKYNIFQMPLVVSYETDFWLQKRKRTQAQKKLVEAYKENLKTASLLIAAEVASTYFNLVSVDKLIEIQEKQITIYKDYISLLNNKYESGLISYVEINNRTQELSELEALLNEYKLQQKVLIHQLIVLMGDSTYNSEAIERNSIDNLNISNELPSGLPSDLILRRPDILAKEAELKALNLQVSIARREFLPNFDLAGQFGYASTKLSNFLDWKSHFALFSATLVHNLFTGGSKIARLKASKARYEQKLYDYHQTILKSFQEVEDSLTSIKCHSLENTKNLDTINIAKDNYNLIKDQYDAGLTSYLDVIQSENILLSYDKEQTQTKTKLLIDSISLYKALGGGY